MISSSNVVVDAKNLTMRYAVAGRLDVEVFPRDDWSDARYWRCDSQTIPCGGLHLSKTAAVGELRLKRESLGTGKERISCEFPFASINLSRYGPAVTGGNLS